MWARGRPGALFAPAVGPVSWEMSHKQLELSQEPTPRVDTGHPRAMRAFIRTSLRDPAPASRV